MKTLALVLLLLASYPCHTLFAQNFVFEPVVNKIQVEGACYDEILDTVFSIRNVTSSPLTISAIFKGYRGWDRSSKMYQLAPNAVAPISVYFDAVHLSVGSYYDTMTISDGITSIAIPAEAVIKPYALSAEGWQSVYLQGIKVGETKCATYWGRNRTQKPITFYDASADAPFQLNPRVPFPYVLLPGEDLPLFDVCFTATKVNESAWDRLSTNIGTYDDDHPGPLDIRAYSVVDTTLLKPCFELIFPKAFVGPALIGGDLEEQIFVQSNRYTDQALEEFNFFEGDVDAFTIVNTTFPVTVAPLEKKAFTVRFSPQVTAPVVKYRYAAKVKLTGQSCTSPSIDLVGIAMLPTADSISTPLLPDKEYVLGMSGTSPSFTKDFHFVNNGTANVKVVSVGFANPSPEFSIANITPTNVLPFTLMPSEKLTVTVLFTPSKPNKIFSNHLIITTENGIQSASYEIQAMQTSTGSVGTHVTESGMTVSPNPARTEVTVMFEDAIAEKIEVFDLLGNSVKTFELSGNSWSWKFADDQIAKGAYFIRAEGRSNDGLPFKATKYLIVE